MAKGHFSAPALPPCSKGRGQLPSWLRRPCGQHTERKTNSLVWTCPAFGSPQQALYW